MPFVTKYGTYFGLPPAALGRIHFVSSGDSYTVDGRSYSASDDNDGLSPERALRTIAQAYTNITASAGEVIFLLPGTHSPAATVRIQKAGVTIAGARSPFSSDAGVSRALGAAGLPSKVSFVTAAAPGFSIEADNVEICFVELQPASGFGTVIFRNASPDALYMHDFVINMAAGQAISLDTAGIDFGYRADVAGLATRSMTRLTGGVTGAPIPRATAYLADFSIVSGGAVGPGVLTATADLHVINGRFHVRAGAWATAFAVATGTGYVYLKSCTWTGQAITAYGVQLDGTNAGIVASKVTANDCRFHPKQPGINSPADNWAPGVLYMAECYEGNNNLTGVSTGAFVGLSTPYQTISSV